MNILNSKNINIDGIPKLPPVGYYNVDENLAKKGGLNYNSFDTLNTNLRSCQTTVTGNGLFKNIPKCDGTNNCILPENTKKNKLDIPYYLVQNGLFDSAIANTNNNNIKSTDPNDLINQIKYLSCQLVTARNRQYSSFDFLTSNNNSIYTIFELFPPRMKIPLIILFTLTMYYLVSGFFSSFDVCANVINSIQKDSSTAVAYWIGLLSGISVPMLILAITYNQISKWNLEDLNKYEITQNAEGIKNNDITENDKQIDYITLTLFILLIYGFIGVLFTIKKSSFNSYIYTALIITIMIIIALLVYVLYAYIPYYNTAKDTNIMNIHNTRLKLFIDKSPIENNEDFSTITSNQTHNNKTRAIYFGTGLIIFILSILYFYYNKHNKSSGNVSFISSFIKGLLGSSAILVIPILWVINITVGLLFFPIYPIFMILLRFLRYVGTLIIYNITKNSSKTNYSDNLIKELDNIKDYTPSWGLFGVEELKTILGMCGYENIFSKSFISENNSSNDLSDNKFIASGLLYFLLDKNKGGIGLSAIYMIITIILSSIILFGVFGVTIKTKTP